jgi:hypothetical protein
MTKMNDDRRSIGQTGAPGLQEAQATDQIRRKLAKAALASPVIMTLGPRRVWGKEKNCAPGVISIINSIDGAGGDSAARVSLAPTTVAEVEDCTDCLEKYSRQCDDHESLRATCEAEDPEKAVKDFCPRDEEDQALRETKAASRLLEDPSVKPENWSSTRSGRY